MSDTEPKTEPKPEPTTPEPAAEETVPLSRFAGLESEAKRWKSEAVEMRKRLDELDAAEKKREEERARKAGEFETIEKSLKDEITSRDKTLADMQAQIVRGDLERKLLAAGVHDQDGELVAGLVARRMTTEAPTEEVDAWIVALREKYPPLFAKPSSAAPQTRAGSPDHGTKGDDLNERIMSKDLAVRSAAIKERQQLRKEGRL